MRAITITKHHVYFLCIVRFQNTMELSICITGYYYVDPNGGSVVDAIEVFCRFNEEHSTCIRSAGNPVSLHVKNYLYIGYIFFNINMGNKGRIYALDSEKLFNFCPSWICSWEIWCCIRLFPGISKIYIYYIGFYKNIQVYTADKWQNFLQLQEGRQRWTKTTGREMWFAEDINNQEQVSWF